MNLVKWWVELTSPMLDKMLKLMREDPDTSYDEYQKTKQKVDEFKKQ